MTRSASSTGDGTTRQLVIGYRLFLQGALTIEDRRDGERDLLAEYRGALTLPADELPTAEEIWLRYRASVAHGLAIWMVAQRYSAAFVDLDTRAALDAIDT